MNAESIRMRLNLFKIKNRNVKIRMKKKTMPSFEASVEDFLYDEDDTKVILGRLKNSSNFPVVENKFTTYIKNIADVQQIK